MSLKQKFNFRMFVRAYVFDLIICVVSLFPITLLGNSVILTICFAIFGEDSGVAVTVIVIRTLWAIVIAAATLIKNAKISDDKSDYLKAREGELYDVKRDRAEIINHPKYVNECIAMAFIIAGIAIFSGAWWTVIMPPIFALLNLHVISSRHRKWMESRIRVTAEK